MKASLLRSAAAAGIFLLPLWGPVRPEAQSPELRFGEGVPPDVKRIHSKALRFLASSQDADGGWSESPGPGIAGICVMAFLSGGEDPDYGAWADNVRRGLRHILTAQDGATGYLSGESQSHGSMYQHGFAQLALAEAYGAVNDDLLWRGSGVPEGRRISIARGLQRAAECSLEAQRRNPYRAWRYSIDSSDADTTVSGTVLVGLLAARNAGIPVPDASIDDAMDYFRSMTAPDGTVSYSGGMGGMSFGVSRIRSSIAALVYAMSRKKDNPEYRALARYVREASGAEAQEGHRYLHYLRYYMAQALFQTDFQAWKAWNLRLVGELRAEQEPDGGFASASHGRAYATGMNVLALALNYRLLPVYER